MPRQSGGIEVPADFPLDLYERVVAGAKEIISEASEDTAREFSYGFASVRDRFRGCAEAADNFSSLVEEHGDRPTQPYRYYQEREFFSFVMNGMACVESLHYGLFAFGASVDPSRFPFGNESDRSKVTLKKTRKCFKELPRRKAISDALEKLKTSQEFKDWDLWRRVLFHRGVRGRVIPVGGGLSRYREFGECVGPTITKSLTRDLRRWLANTLRDVFVAADTTVRVARLISFSCHTPGIS